MLPRLLPLLLFLSVGTLAAQPIDADRIQALILVVQEKNPALRALAAEALGERGATAKPALPALRTALRDANPRVCNQAALALVRIEPNEINELITALGDRQPRVRVAVLKAFAEQERLPDSALTPVLRCFSMNNEAVRVHAVVTAARFGKSAVPELVKLLDDKAPAQQASAAWALAIIGPEATPAVPKLLGLANVEHPEIQPRAAHALACIAPADNVVIAALLPLLESFNQEATMQVGPAIQEGIESRGTGGVPFLSQALQLKNDALRSWALQHLAELGPAAASAVPAIFAAYKVNKANDTRNVLSSIGSTGLPALKEAMKDRDADVRVLALQAMQEIGLGEREMLTLLLDAIPDADPGVRVYVADSLGQLGASARDALPQLQKLTQDPDEKVRSSAAAAIATIRTASKP